MPGRKLKHKKHA